MATTSLGERWDTDRLMWLDDSVVTVLVFPDDDSGALGTLGLGCKGGAVIPAEGMRGGLEGKTCICDDLDGSSGPPTRKLAGDGCGCGCETKADGWRRTCPLDEVTP